MAGLGMLASALAGGIGAATGGIANEMIKNDEIDKRNELEKQRMQLQGEISLGNSKSMADYNSAITDKKETDARSRITSAIERAKARLGAGATEAQKQQAYAEELQQSGDLNGSEIFNRRARDIEKDASNNRRLDNQESREERMAKAQERSIGIQAANAARQNKLTDMQLDEYNRKKDAEGYVAGYKIAESKGAKDAAAIYLEQSLGRGVDPRNMKNDPLSSQVSAAKAVLADYTASDEDKESARKVLKLANDSFVASRSKGESEEKQPVRVGGKVIGYATTEKEAIALRDSYLKK